MRFATMPSKMAGISDDEKKKKEENLLNQTRAAFDRREHRDRAERT